MNRRKLFIVVGSIVLFLALVAIPLMAACAEEAPAPTPAPSPAPAYTPPDVIHFVGASTTSSGYIAIKALTSGITDKIGVK